MIRGVSAMSRCDNRAPNSQECVTDRTFGLQGFVSFADLHFVKCPFKSLSGLQQSQTPEPTQTPGNCLLLYCTLTSEVQVLLGSDGHELCFIFKL